MKRFINQSESIPEYVRSWTGDKACSCARLPPQGLDTDEVETWWQCPLCDLQQLISKLGVDYVY